MKKPRGLLYIVESVREREGRVVIESVCFTREDARERRNYFANAQTPHVRIVVYARRARRAKVRGA